ncbi:MAG: hypothetical protein AAF253_05170 [Pseudomonadota bacterium]
MSHRAISYGETKKADAMSVPSYRRLADLPETLAIFPLAGAMLFPRWTLSLNIFEALETSPYLEDVFLESTNAAFFTAKAKVPALAGDLDLYRQEPARGDTQSEDAAPALAPSPSGAGLNISSDARRANGTEKTGQAINGQMDVTGGDNG